MKSCSFPTWSKTGASRCSQAGIKDTLWNFSFVIRVGGLRRTDAWVVPRHIAAEWVFRDIGSKGGARDCTWLEGEWETVFLNNYLRKENLGRENWKFEIILFLSIGNLISSFSSWFISPFVMWRLENDNLLHNSCILPISQKIYRSVTPFVLLKLTKN